MKNFGLELLKITEMAAIAASKYIGSGDKLKIDEVATNVMRDGLNAIGFIAKVSICEGEKDDSFMLYNGERVGIHKNGKSFNSTDYPELSYAEIQNISNNFSDPKYTHYWKLWEHEYDLAIDSVDGTSQTSKNGIDAMSIIAMSEKDCLFSTKAFYMNKIAVGKHIAKNLSVSLETPIEETIESIKKLLNKDHIMVCLLDRPRHTQLISKLKACGCYLKLIGDCDVAGSMLAAMPDNTVDMFFGIGGVTEGVLSAAAIKCLDGYFEGQIVDNATYQPIDGKIYSMEMLAKGNVIFAATGILNGNLLKGVQNKENGVITHSILLESSIKNLKRIESYY